VLQVARSFILSDVSQAIAANFKNAVYAHVQALPVRFHLQHQRGDLVSLLTYETDRLSGFLTGTLLSLPPQMITLVGAIVMIILLDPVLAVPVTIGIPLAIFLSKLFGRHFRSVANDWQSAYRRLVGAAENNLAMIPAIKAFGREPQAIRIYAGHVETLRGFSVRTARRQSLLAPIMSFAAASAVVLLLWISRGRLEAGALETREFVSFLLYAALLTRPVSGLADLWGQFQSARGALERIDEVLALNCEQFDVGAEPGPIEGNVVFDNVTFSHLGRAPVLRGISLIIPAGQAIAITGENGAGKTTLVELLLRFYSPSNGRILLDGSDIEDMRLDKLREAIGIVPQQSFLFEGTLRENISFGNPVASEEDLERAIEQAQASRLVQTLPDGLETMIGDKGVKLSGGERQRVALARALLKDPPILVMDEPTAMFDPEGEAAFVASVRDALTDRTVVLITHRPASLALVDRVVTLQDGRIISDILNRVDRPKKAVASGGLV
jgi:ATP-binding cassette, subfamily B, bacterial